MGRVGAPDGRMDGRLPCSRPSVSRFPARFDLPRRVRVGRGVLSLRSYGHGRCSCTRDSPPTGMTILYLSVLELAATKGYIHTYIHTYVHLLCL